MSFVGELREARKRSVVILHDFLLNLNPSQNRIHAFFESDEDLSFYSNFIYQRISEGYKVHNYQCDGKGQVYRAYEKIGGRQLGANIALFFVDKDLDEFLGREYAVAPNIFVTDYYSIENYLVNAYMLERVVNELFHVKRAELSLEEIKLSFESSLREFYDLMRPLMAWVIYLRRCSVKVNLNNANNKLDRVLNVDIDFTVSMSTEDAIGVLDEVCNVTTPPDFVTQRDSIMQELKEICPKMWIRGKYELWFFVSFCKKLRDRVKADLKDGQKLSIKTNIELSNAVEVLAPRAVCPDRLKAFLNINQVDRDDSGGI